MPDDSKEEQNLREKIDELVAAMRELGVPVVFYAFNDAESINNVSFIDKATPAHMQLMIVELDELSRILVRGKVQSMLQQSPRIAVANRAFRDPRKRRH